MENNFKAPKNKGMNEIDQIKKRICEIEAEHNNLKKQLSTLLSAGSTFSSEEKIKIFRELFRGREDVYPKRWDNKNKSGYSPTCSNEWVRGLCNKPKVKCSECPNQAFLKVSDDIILKHLTGKTTIGIYPLLGNECCWFLAADFDKKDWQKDIAAFIGTCKSKNVPAYMERSRSGKGGHVWIFFSAPVAASKARRMGTYLLTETMKNHPNLGFSSYDRFFPNQDTMPVGGFGNLIALPLQYNPRQNGNSVFLDDTFNPHADQWSFLSSIKRMSPEEIEAMVPETTDFFTLEEPWKEKLPRLTVPYPIKIVLCNQLYIEKQSGHLPPQLINRLIRIAAFKNPEFYRAQAMRLPVFNKPRIIACAENFTNHIGLPRGCLDEVIDLFKSLNIEYKIVDERNSGKPLRTKFLGTLNKEQRAAAKGILTYDTGVLSAPTGFGKTVIAAHVIAKRKRNTLILVHRKHLLKQWMTHLQTFLDLKQIGQIRSGKQTPSGQVDVALIQSLIRKEDWDGNYGQIIFDECHHLSAVSFEVVAKKCKAKHVLGLTATPVRKDGQHPIIFMQCGPIRYEVKAQKRPFDHFVISRYTEFISNSPIQTIYSELAKDERRNNMIIKDVMNSLKNKRSPIILTERREHVSFFAERLSGFVKHIVILQGGMSYNLEDIKDHEERILIATGRYIGEGFDDPRLDTLFLAMPISWKGTLTQYVGRLHRLHHNKTKVEIYDYIDNKVPVLKRMSEKRIAEYKNMGYEIT